MFTAIYYAVKWRMFPPALFPINSTCYLGANYSASRYWRLMFTQVNLIGAMCPFIVRYKPGCADPQHQRSWENGFIYLTITCAVRTSTWIWKDVIRNTSVHDGDYSLQQGYCGV